MIILPVYNVLLLPGVTVYLQKDYISKQSGEEEPDTDEEILFLVRRKETEGDGLEGQYYPIGLRGQIESVGEDGTAAVRLLCRINLDSVEYEDDTMSVAWSEREETMDMDSSEMDARFRKLKVALFRALNRFRWGVMARGYISDWSTIEETMVYTSYLLNLTNDEKYQILATDLYSERFEKMEKVLYEYIEMFLMSAEADEEQQEHNERAYRESAIRRQMEYLQTQLEQMHPENESDIRRFEKKIEESGMNETARAEAEKALNRLKQEGQNGHEYGMLYSYLDFITGLSWKKEAFEPISMKEARRILDADHFGMKKVKTRVLQQLAVMNLNRKQSGSILLFVGAPGTGKTSIGKSIAAALNRKYVRISLGGVRDEADIRGHRRTYIGAMPGRIMDGIHRSGVSNPVVVLDEVDKLSRDYSGDPASALLEVLDPEQNFSFTDHYMNVPYDLSDVLFICTANRTDTIPEPLLNRMEVVEFQGYTESEKVQIAKRHLLPRALEQAGMKKGMLRISDGAWHVIISDYTMEAGVRNLRRQIDTLCRAAAVRIAEGKAKGVSVSEKTLERYLDRKPIRHDRVLEKKAPGIVTGLAWTQAGGDILFIETMFSKGKGKQVITGQLGDVMKESVQIAVTLVKNLFPEKSELFQENDIHIHVPAGAVPKDGPSAGITMTTALASLASGRAVDPRTAMTGEVSLRGAVLPIGGLPEKLLAAVRSGVETVYIPEDNVRDLDDVPDEVKSRLNIVPVTQVTDVLKATGILDG